MSIAKKPAALVSAAVMSVGMMFATPAYADVREVSGYESCPAGQYVGLRITLERPQTIKIYIGGRLQRSEYTTITYYTYHSLTAQGSWKVTGADIETVSDYCYTPTSGPAF